MTTINIASLFQCKKGAETWELVLIIIGIVLLLALGIWYFALNRDLGTLLGKLGEMF